MVPWCRIGPYVIGVLAGYVLYLTNGGKNLKMKWVNTFGQTEKGGESESERKREELIGLK